MEHLFWASLFGASYSYFLYPLCLLLLPRRHTEPSRTPSGYPFVSIIIAARNEEGRIDQKLQNTLAADYPPERREIVVASDASTDRTEEIVRRYAQKGVRLVRSPERKGKERAQLLAIGESRGDILVFTDVGTSIPPEAISAMATAFADITVGAVSSEDRVISRNDGIASEGLYIQYEMWVRSLESSVNTLVGLSGSFFGARRAVCELWDTESPSDFRVAFNCRRSGYVAISDPKVLGYYAEIKNDMKEYRRKVRTVLRGIGAVFREPAVLNPFRFGLFAFQVWSHKIMRWVVPWFLLPLLVSSIALANVDNLYLTAAILQVAFYVFAAAAFLSPVLRRFSLFKVPFYFVQSNAAIAHATVAFLMGKRAIIWEPSVR